MAEVRYRGRRSWWCQPGLRRQHQVRRRVAARAARHRRRAGDGDGPRHPQGVLRRPPTPFFVDYVRRYTDLPFLVTLEERRRRLPCPGKFLTAADLGRDRCRGRRVEDRCCSTPPTDAVGCRNGSLGFRYAEAGDGKWNLDLDGVVPQLSCRRRRRRADRCCCRASTPRRRRHVAAPRRAGPRRSAGTLVTTVFDLMLAQYGVTAAGPAGRLADRLRRRRRAVHPGLAGADHRRAGRGGGPDRPGVRRQRRGAPAAAP